jgi:hypothetical protein
MVSAPKPCINFCFPPYKPHASPISSSVIWSIEEHAMRSVNHEAPHCPVFSSLPLLLPPQAEISSSGLYSGTPSACVLPSKWATKFHTHIKQLTKIRCCGF